MWVTCCRVTRILRALKRELEEIYSDPDRMQLHEAGVRPEGVDGYERKGDSAPHFVSSRRNASRMNSGGRSRDIHCGDCH